MGERPQPRGQGDGRAAAATAAGLREVVGVPGFAEHLVEGLRARPELGNVRLADADRARLANALDDQIVLLGDVVAEELGALGGADAGREVEILVGHRQAVKDTERVAAGNRLVCTLRALEAALGKQTDDRVEARVHRFDALEVCGHHLDGRELPTPDPVREISRGCETQVAQGRRTSGSGWRYSFEAFSWVIMRISSTGQSPIRSWTTCWVSGQVPSPCG